MKSNNKGWVSLSSVLGTTVVLLLAWSTVNAGSLFNFGSKTASDSKLFGVERSSGGDVTVNLKPVEFEDGKLKVRIRIDTHNVDDLYKYNLKAVTRLVIGTKSISPVSAPRLGGHHNNGKLIFEIERLPEKFTILIEGLHSKDTRKFDWP